MKILVLSFYFRPDLCAGSFRATALLDALRELVPAGSRIDVVSALPNRYRSFTVDAPQAEHQAGLSVYRIVLPEHQSGMLDQSMAFLAYAQGAVRQVAGQDYDLVFATSSRLMTAVLGAWIARRKRARLYIDMRDIFADIIKDVLPLKLAWLAGPFFSALEAWAIKRADKVNLVSPGFLEYFTTRYPGLQFSCFTNGIDDEFLAAVPARSPAPASVAGTRPLTVLYAGNLGEGQGMHAIIPELARRMGPAIHFRIIGDGGRRHMLEAALSKAGVTNVELLPPVRREQLLEAYRTADVLFLHLNAYDAFRKVLPSKLFEYAALGKPVWAGVAGYSAEFIESEISNSAVFHPCDADEAARVFERLTIQDIPRSDFVAKYARKRICLEMARDIISVAEGAA